MSEPVMRGIENSWTLLEFMRKKGMPKLAQKLVNKQDGSEFSALMFPTKQGDNPNTMVAFSSKLGTLTMEQLFQMRNELQIVELAETHNLYLCKQGEGGWESSTHSAAEWGF